MFKIHYISAVILITFFGTSSLFAQNVMSKEIQHHKSRGEVFEMESEVFRAASGLTNLDHYFTSPGEVMFLEYESSILDNNNRFISLDIPFKSSMLTLDLMDVSAQFNDYSVVTHGEEPYTRSEGNKYYRGIVKGDHNSLVALSFFQDNVIGVISTNEGNFNIVKLKDSQQYIIYSDENLKDQPSYDCSTEVDKFTDYDPKVLAGEGGSTGLPGDCVRFYFETEFDMFQSLGSVANVENYVTGVYNNVATIYLNESIATSISEINVWNVTDPYTATGTAALLTQFQGQISSFNGDLGHLLTFRNVGGGRAAGFSGICNSNVDQRLCVSGNLSTTITPFPTYSWNVMVITHEFGHLFGSRHTHACVWNGNNTAIDGCAGSTEGGCPTPGNPVGGGTIMSYCHITSVGINFNLGFGPQPGNVIRNSVNNATCLSPCCPNDLVLNTNIPAFGVDHQEAALTITALNTINSGGEAVYHAGEEVLLLDDFTSVNGSVFRAYIEGCTGNFVRSFEPSGASDENSSIQADETTIDFLISPNPTENSFSVLLQNPDLDWELYSLHLLDLNGQEVQVEQIPRDGQLIKVNISHLPNGIYLVKVVGINNREVRMKKIVKM